LVSDNMINVENSTVGKSFQKRILARKKHLLKVEQSTNEPKFEGSNPGSPGEDVKKVVLRQPEKFGKSGSKKVNGR
jgi:hypothetical protein